MELSEKHKRVLGLVLALLFVIGVAIVHSEGNAPPGEVMQEIQTFFTGAWMPSQDPIQVGPENFATLTNMRYGSEGLEGVQGYSKINSTAISVAQNYTRDFTEIDVAGDRVDADADTVTITNYTKDERVLYYKELDADYINGDFINTFSVKVQNSTPPGLAVGSGPAVWGCSKIIPTTYLKNAVQRMQLRVEYASAIDLTHMKLVLNVGSSAADCGSSAELSDSSIALDFSTTYYIKVNRSSVTGAYGTLYAYIYSDSGFTTLVDTLTITQCREETYSYIWTFSGTGVLGGGSTTVMSPQIVIEDLDASSEIKSGAHLRTNYATSSYALVQALECGGEQKIFPNTTAIPSTGSFNSTALYVAGDGASDGRWSQAPNGSVAYANGVEACVFSGDEMPVAGFGTFQDITVTSSAISFAAAEDACGDPALNFSTLGFKPGNVVTVTGATNNSRTYSVEKIQADAGTYDELEFYENVTQNDAAGSAITLTASPAYGGYTHYIDYSKAVNNTLTTEGNTVPIGGGIDSDAVLALHCDGTDGSTTFTDSSTTPHTITATNGAKVSTADVKFGTGSGVFDGTDDFLTTPDSADWDMDSGLFTIDFWVRFDESFTHETELRGLFQQHVSNINFIHCYAQHNRVTFWMYESSTGYSVYARGYVPTDSWITGKWYHISIVRGWGGGANTVAVTIDGKATTPATAVGDMPNLAAAFEIGRFYGGSAYYYLHGNIDEFRVSKGIARWTQDFGPYDRPYRTAEDMDWMVFSRRPLEGVKYYVLAANGDTSTMTGRVWNGNDFTTLTMTDGTSSGGVSLAQTGTVSFDSTVGIARPLNFEGGYFYTYWFTLSAGSADVYHVTVDAPFQPVTDLWDGVYRRCINFQVSDAGYDSYSDYTLEVNEGSYAGNTIGADINSLPTNDHIIMTFQDRMAGFFFAIPANEMNVNVAVPLIEYRSTSGWTSVGYVADGTVSDGYRWESMGQSGFMSWTPPSEGQEIQSTMFGVTGYAYRLRWSAQLSAAAMIDTVTGVSAQKPVGAYTFPAMYKDRLMLCGAESEKQLNRMDYSGVNSTEVWNGEMASNGTLQSLYFGGGEPLTGAVQLYNRFEAEVYAFLLVLKESETYLLTGDTPADFKIYPISKNIGCPAPATLVATETGYEMAEDMQRQVALWVSASGPVLFDGGVLQPIKGLETYFDPSSANVLTLTDLANAVGWYDTAFSEYNIVFPTDSKWFVYNLLYKKWFLKSPPTYADCTWPVIDTAGKQYTYAGIDGGYMMRLENGTTWDGTGITQTVETGDFMASKSMWDQTIIRRFKFLFKDTTESISCAITHYPNTNTSGTSLTAVNLNSGTGRLGNDIQETNLVGWSHRFKWSATSSATTKGMQPMGWGCKFKQYREER